MKRLIMRNENHVRDHVASHGGAVSVLWMIRRRCVSLLLMVRRRCVTECAMDDNDGVSVCYMLSMDDLLGSG